MLGSEFIFMSCGDFDGHTLKSEAKRKKLQIPSYLRRWINLKKAFPIHKFDADKPALDFSTPKTIKECRAQVNGMTQMLDVCGLQLEGRHHSGIDDAKNIARVAIKLLESGYEFTQGMVHVSK